MTCTALLLAGWAAAASPVPSPMKKVRASFAGAAAEEDAFLRSARELLARLGVELETAPSEEAAFATAALDCTENDACSLSFASADGRLEFRRRIERGRSAALATEVAAHVLHSAVEELLLGRPRPPLAAAVEAPSPATVAETPAPERVEWALDVAGFFAGHSLGSERTALGGGLGLRLQRPLGSWRPALALSVALHAPVEVRGELVNLQTQSLALRLLPSVELFRAGELALELAVGGGADLFFTTPMSTALPPGRLFRAGPEAVPVASAQLEGRWALTGSTGLFLALGLDVDLAPVRYVATVGGQRDVVFSPARLRPALFAGLAFTPWSIGGEP